MSPSLVLIYLLGYGSATAVGLVVAYSQRKRCAFNVARFGQGSQYVLGFSAVALMLLTDPYMRLYEDAYAVTFSDNELIVATMLLVPTIFLGIFFGLMADSSTSDTIHKFISSRQKWMPIIVFSMVAIFLVTRTIGHSLYTDVAPLTTWIYADMTATYFFLWYLFGFAGRMLLCRRIPSEK